MDVNFYDVLELDPDGVAPSNRTVIDAAIEAKKREWTRQRNDPRPQVKKQAERNQKEVLPLLQAGDLATWTTHHQQCLGRRRAQRRAVEEQLEEFADLKGGTLTEGEVARFASKQDVLSEAEVRGHLSARGVRIVADGQAGGSDADPLPLYDEKAFAAIVRDLDIVGRRDLYEYLEAEGKQQNLRRANAARLRTLGKEVADRVRKLPRERPTYTEMNSLARACAKAFADDDSRRRYDNSTEFEGVRRLLAEKIELHREGDVVPPRVRHHFAETARKAGFSPIVVEAYLAAECDAPPLSEEDRRTLVAAVERGREALRTDDLAAVRTALAEARAVRSEHEDVRDLAARLAAREDLLAAVDELDAAVAADVHERGIVEAWQRVQAGGGHPRATPRHTRVALAERRLKAFEELSLLRNEDVEHDRRLLAEWTAELEDVRDPAFEPLRRRRDAAVERMAKRKPRLREPQPLDAGRRFLGVVYTAKLLVGNDGDANLTCRLSADGSWLRLPTANLIVPPGRAETVPVHVDLRGVPAGPLAGFVRLETDGGDFEVPVSVTGAEPTPGRLEVAATSVELGSVVAGTPHTFRVTLENAGETPLTVEVILPDEAADVLKPARTSVALAGLETTELDVELVASEESGAVGERVETILFRPRVGDACEVGVRFRIASKPSTLDRYLTCASIVAPLVLLPALAGAFFTGPAPVLVFSLAAWLALPVGMWTFDRVWCNRNASVEVLGLTLAGLTGLWLASPLVIRIVDVIVGFFVRLLLHAVPAGAVTSAAAFAGIGAAWLTALTQSKQLREEEARSMAPPVMAVFMLYGLWRGAALALGGGSSASGSMIGDYANSIPFAGFVFPMLLAIAVSIGHAGLRDEASVFDAQQARWLWSAAIPVCACVALLGVGVTLAGVGTSAAFTLDHWTAVARFQFLRIH